jgi:alpha-L-rhamnosidase
MRVMLAAAFTALATSGALAGPSAPDRLRVEYMEEPMGVDVSVCALLADSFCFSSAGLRAPGLSVRRGTACSAEAAELTWPRSASQYPLRFSWSLEHSERGQQQTAYQIVVSDGKTAVWDSKKTASNVTQNVPIGVAKLKADTSYTWSVKWWDSAGTESPEGTAKFSTGLYTEADWKGAKWIGGAMGQYRGEHKLKGAVERVVAYVIGLGYYKLHVNGKKVSTHELGAFTTYTERVYYDTHDITDAVLLGGGSEMVLGMSLGDGWYAQKSVNVGKPQLMARVSITYADGTTEDFISDTTWKYNAGPVTSVDIYNGENYNATMETPGWTEASATIPGDWGPTKVAEPPSDHVKLTSHAILPPIRIGEDYSPVNFWQSAPGEYVFDFGQNMAGFATLFLPEGLDTVPGTEIAMFHAEMIHGPPENKSKIFHHYGNAKETNTYVTKGEGEEITYTPLFTCEYCSCGHSERSEALSQLSVYLSVPGKRV